MPTKKQTSVTDSTAAPAKPVDAKKPAAEKASTPVASENGASAKKAPAKKPAAEKAEKPAAQKTATAAKTTASAGAAATKLFGEIEASGKDFFIQNGSIPEGQMQLVLDKGKKDLTSRLPGYAGQFVTVLGEYGKQKKTDKFPTFVVKNLVSHNEIGHRAFELSHDNPTTVEDNWFRAENELLNR
jgi:membrane protein involved in colicin uptake